MPGVSCAWNSNELYTGNVTQHTTYTNNAWFRTSDVQQPLTV